MAASYASIESSGAAVFSRDMGFRLGRPLDAPISDASAAEAGAGAGAGASSAGAGASVEASGSAGASDP